MIPKFRAWDKKNKSMHEVEVIDFSDSIGYLSIENDKGDWYSFEGDTILMQSTGLKDKNGVDVYQRDIIRCTSGWPHEVIWLEEYGGTFIGGMPAWYLSGLNNGHSWTGEEEVIGNVWENSDLLGD